MKMEVTHAVLLLALTAVFIGTTQAAVPDSDTVPPLFEKEPVAMAVYETSFMLRLTMNEPGIIYYSVVKAGSPPPTSMQVLLGTVEDQVAGGTVMVPAADVSVGAEIDNLPVPHVRQLDVYLVAEDLAGNIMPQPQRLAVDLADFTEPAFPHGFPKIKSLGTEYVNVELGLDEPGYVYYVMQHSLLGDEPDTTITPATIRACAIDKQSCSVPNVTFSGLIEIGEPAPGLNLPWDGGNLFEQSQVHYKPGSYWMHFTAEDDERQPNLMSHRNIVRRKLASVTPPTWSDKGADPYYVNVLKDSTDPIQGYATYVDPGIFATNPTTFTDITQDVVVTHNVDMSLPGEYLVQFSVTYYDSGNAQYVTGTNTRVVIVQGPWAPAYKGFNNGLNEAEGNNPGSCCEWYRTCRLEDFLFDCTQDVIDSCSSSDTGAKCIICLQLDSFANQGWGYQKYSTTKPDPTQLGRDAIFVGYIRPDEMERQQAMGNFPGLMGPAKPGYLAAPVHHLEKSSGKPQRSTTVEILSGGHNWRDRLSDGRYDLLANHNVRRRSMLAATTTSLYQGGYITPDNVRSRNFPNFKHIKGSGTVKVPKFSVCRAVRFQCSAFQDVGSGLCLPQGGNSLREWDYEKNHATFVKNEVRSNILQQHLEEKKRHTDPVWQR